MKPAAMIFDLDGTLLDSMYIWKEAPLELVRRHGANPPPDLADALTEMGRREAADYLIQTFSLTAKPEELMAEINDIVTAEYLEKVPLKPGVSGLLPRLKKAGCPLCIATASEAFQAQKALERLGMWKYFDFAVSCIQYGGKTTPAVYLEACRRMRTQPEETVVFEDALHAAKTAKKAGFLVAGVYDASAERDQEELASIADWYITDLNEWHAEIT